MPSSGGGWTRCAICITSSGAGCAAMRAIRATSAPTRSPTAAASRRPEPPPASMALVDDSIDAQEHTAFRLRLNRIYLWYTVGFLLFILAMALFERMGMPKRWIGVTFLLSTVVLYACIGIISRTTDATEYYVAGRRVPAIYNGMATAADWMSAASFIGLAGTLYLQGYGGLAFILGWTGGYVLVALLIAPYLRRFGQYTIPDFLAARFPVR